MKLHPVDALHVLYFTLVGATVVAFSARVPEAPALAAANLGAAAAIGLFGALVLDRLERGRATVGRCAIAMIVIPFAFTELAMIVGHVNPRRYEEALLAIDVDLFGFDPMRALEPYHAAPLTELLQVVYSSFYFLPLLLGISLGRRRMWAELETAIATIVLGFYVSYVGYVIVPAQSPYHVFEYEKPLEGLLLVDRIRASIDTLEIHRLNCFPSGHVEVTFVVVALAWKWARRLFLFLLPWGLLLWLGTIYLRYHYTIDTLVGLALVPPVLAAGRWLARTTETVPGTVCRR